MIDTFIEFADNNSKIAIIDKAHRLSFNDFLTACEKMKSFFIQSDLTGKKAVIFLYPDSFLFYVSVFAGVMAGVTLVIPDSFRDRKRTEQLLRTAGAEYVLVDNLTSFFAFLIPGLKKIRVNEYARENTVCKGTFPASIITFTSGTTGTLKSITRTVDYLFRQEAFIRNNIEIEDNDVVFCGLPMYTVLSIYSGHTTIIGKTPKNQADVFLTSIKAILKMKKPLPVSKCFLGGAILYENEVSHIRSIVPKARIRYVYGATESALIYMTDLDTYEKHPFSFDTPVEGVSVRVQNPNKDGVGLIALQGDIVITDDVHLTGDIGKIENGILSIYGREKYSILNAGLYNYLIDSEIRKNNKSVKAAFSFAADNKIHVVYEGKISKKNPDYIYHQQKKLKYDSKHRTKLDYRFYISKIAPK